jgi:phosphatidylglycerol:prolipoprotein diacylglycerol transferase
MNIIKNCIDFSSLIWNYGPDIFTIGSFQIRWYSIIIASTFIIADRFLRFAFSKAGKEEEKVKTLIVYIMIGALLGARIFHVIFYDWDYYSSHPIEILLPFKFYPSFKFQGFTGLASHGVIIGLFVSLFLGFKKINREGTKTTFLWLGDKVVIIAALCSCMVRLGNFMNSELYGDPTTNNFISVIYVRDAVNIIKNSGSFVESISVAAIPKEKPGSKDCFNNLVFNIKFKKGMRDEAYINKFLEKNVKFILTAALSGIYENITEPKDTLLNYSIKNEKGVYTASVYTTGIKRHPSQLYEAFTYALLFILLFSLWYFKRDKLREGVLFGLFLIIAMTLRIFHEMLKAGQVIFETKYGIINCAQILSIPIIIMGIVIYFWTYKRRNTQV